jgi:hypothetical protein
MVLSAALAVGCEVKPATGPSVPASPSTPAAAPSAEPAFTVKAEDLAREYETNAEAADARYKGKWGVVAGLFDDAQLFPGGQLNVSVQGFVLDPKKNFGLGHILRCSFVAASLGKAGDLTKGQKLEFKGKCEGERGGTYVDFSDCEVLKIGPDPALPVTAAQLTRDYVADEKAADAKYTDKYLLLEGIVVELKEKGSVLHVILEGHDEKSPTPVRVAAAYPADRKDEFVRLKKGDKIKIKGKCGGRFLGEVLVSYARIIH